MGVYSFNSHITENYSVQPDMSYTGLAGAATILAESYRDDLDIFNSVIESDFREAYARNSRSVNESAIEVIKENAFTNFFEKIKKFFVAIWQKIKGLLTKFTDFVRNVVIRDNKKFVDATKDRIRGKNFSKFEYTYRPEKESLTKSTVVEVKAAVGKLFPNEVLFETMRPSTAIANYRVDFTPDKVKQITKDNSGKALKEKIYKAMGFDFSGSANLMEKLSKKYFGPEKTKTGATESDINKYAEILVGSKEEIKSAEDELKETNDWFTAILNNIDDLRKEVSDLISDVEKNGTKNISNITRKNANGFGSNEDVRGDDGRQKGEGQSGRSNAMTKGDLENVQRGLNVAYDAGKETSTVMAEILGGKIQLMKERIKEARSIYAKAVSYGPKKESAFDMDEDFQAALYEAYSYEMDEDEIMFGLE